MSYFLVGDGGGTKTDTLLFDERGRVLAVGHSAGANANFIDPQSATRNVAAAIRSALAQAEVRPEQVARIALFIPGFRRCLPLLGAELGRDDFELHGDAENALYTAFGERRGIAVLAGTGSFAIGRDAQGTECRVGGWGPLFGDQGSAWHIGVLALRHLAAEHDRTGKSAPESMLERLILSEIGAADLPDLRRAAYVPEFTRDRVAALAPLVAQAAESGEVAAAEILRKAAEALAQQARSVADRLQVDALPVALIGGVTRIGAHFPELFAQAIAAVAPMLEWRMPLFEPIVGSALFLLDDHFSPTSDELRAAGSQLMHFRSYESHVDADLFRRNEACAGKD